MKDAKFTAQSYYPGDRYRILIYEPKRNLIARYHVQGESPGEITIKLQPAGSLKGRLIDKDAAPIDGVELYAVQTSRMNKTDRVTIPPKSLERKQHTDADGRFHLKGFLPGVKYTISAIGTRKFNGQEFPAELGQIPFGKALKAGQTVELGDVKFK